MGPGHGRDRFADLALAVYAEELVDGRHVLVVGDATSGLAERLVELGARHATIADPDVVRARLTTSRTSDVRVVAYEGGALPFASESFDAAFVPDLGAVDAPALVDDLARLLRSGGVLVAAAGNPDAPRGLASERASVPYYELYEMLNARFPAVRMLGQSPFVGWALVDFGAADGDSAVTLDGSLVEIPEDPERFVALCAASDVALEPYVVVQAPMSDLLGGDDTATEIGAPIAPAADVIARAVAEAESRVRAEAAQVGAELGATREERDRTRGELGAAERELAAMRARTEELEAAGKAAASRVEALAARIEELTEELASRDDERDAQIAYAEDIEREIAEREREIAKLRDELGAKTRDAESAGARVAALAAQLAEREAALAAKLAEREAALAAKLAERETSLATKSAEHERVLSARVAEHDAAIAAAAAERARLERELGTARAEVELLRASLAEDTSADFDALERAMRQQGETVRALEAEIARRDGLVRGLAAELAEARGEGSDFEDVTVPLEASLESPKESVLRAGLAQAHTELTEAHAVAARVSAESAREIEELRGELAHARDRLVNAEANRTAAAFRVDEVASELLVARAERDRTKAELIAARAAEAEAQQAARRALEESRATSEALDDVDEDRARVSGALLGALRRVAELEVERDARARDADDGAMAREVETARFEARTLATEIETMRGREAELVGRIRGLALRNRELTSELDDASKRAARADEDAWTSLASRTALSSTATELEDRCRRAEVERTSALERVAELEATVRNLRDRSDDAGMEIARMRAIEASLGERMMDVQQDAERARKRADELEVREDALKIEAARLNALASSFQDRAEGLAQELEGTKRGFRARLSELSAELDRRAHRERVVAGEAKFLRERMQEWTERLEAGEQAATKALEELSSRSDRLGELEATVARAEERAASLSGERDGLRLLLADRAAASASLRERLEAASAAHAPASAGNGAGQPNAVTPIAAESAVAPTSVAASASTPSAPSGEAASLRGERDGLRLRLRDLGEALTAARASAAGSTPADVSSPSAPSTSAMREPASDLEGALVRATDTEGARNELELANEKRANKALREKLAEVERSASDLKWYLGERDAKIRGLEADLRDVVDKARGATEKLELATRASAETHAHLEARVRHLEGELGEAKTREASVDETLRAQRERLADAERRATEAAQRASEGERRAKSAEGASALRDPQIGILQREAGERDVLLRSLAAQLEERDDRIRMLEQRLQQVERDRRTGGSTEPAT